jgi:hypothetical protein
MPLRIAHLQRLSMVPRAHDQNRIPRPELRVPLGMSRIHPAIPVDRTLASALFRDAPEDDEEEEDEGEREGYSE